MWQVYEDRYVSKAEGKWSLGDGEPKVKLKYFFDMIIESSILIDGKPADENDEKEISAKITETFLIANTEIILNKNLTSQKLSFNNN